MYEIPTSEVYDNYHDYNVNFFTQLPNEVQQDLIGWYNVQEKDLNITDKQRLLRLYKKGLFQAWDCPKCGDRVYRGNPENYYTEEYLESLCDNCRCYAN